MFDIGVTMRCAQCNRDQPFDEESLILDNNIIPQSKLGWICRQCSKKPKEGIIPE